MNHQQIKGFTLIELMVVVLLVAILASIAIPSYNNYLRRTELSELVSLTQGMQMAVVTYVAENRSWPTKADIDGHFPHIKHKAIANALPGDIGGQAKYLDVTDNKKSRLPIEMKLDNLRYGSGATLYMVGQAGLDKDDKADFSLVMNWQCEYKNINTSYLPDVCEIEYP